MCVPMHISRIQRVRTRIRTHARAHFHRQEESYAILRSSRPAATNSVFTFKTHHRVASLITIPLQHCAIFAIEYYHDTLPIAPAHIMNSCSSHSCVLHVLLPAANYAK